MPREISILSPEKVSLEYTVAGLGSRLLAQILDMMIWGAQWLFLFIAVTVSLSILTYYRITPNETMSTALLVGLALYGFITFYAYFIFFEARWNGQTPGKRAFSIRVIMDNGAPVTVEAVFKRGVMRIADLMLTFLGITPLVVFFTERSQRFGDMVAGTVLIHERKHTVLNLPSPVLTPVVETPEHPLAMYIGLIDSLGQDDYRSIRQFLDRHKQLSSDVSNRLASQMVEALASRGLNITCPNNTPPSDVLEAIAAKYSRKNALL
ncbi:MAG: RDD family protein [bacterium]